MTAPILVDFRKWPDTRHWQYHMHPLGEDEHGRWLWAPSGTPAQRGDEPPTAFEFTTVTLVADVWAASFFPQGARTDLYVDIVAPPVWSDGVVTMVDLDLDVIRFRDGRILIDDEDEFAEHQVTLGYPEHLVAGATEAAEHVRAAVERGDEPFGSVGRAWLERALAVGADRSGP